MPPLTNPEILACYRNAMTNRRVGGYVEFNERARRGMLEVLPGYTLAAFKEELYEFVVVNSGTISQTEETREQWREEWEFHYDIRLPLAGKRIYIETRLRYCDPNDPDDPIILVVNVHLA